MDKSFPNDKVTMWGDFSGVTLQVKLIGGAPYEPLYQEMIPIWEEKTGGKVEILSKKSHFELDKEINESKPKLMLEIRDVKGELVDRINGSTKKGINRVTWNLSKPLPVTLNSNSRNYQSSIPVKPGKYSLQLLELVNGELKELTKSKTFNVKRIRENVLKNPLTT